MAIDPEVKRTIKNADKDVRLAYRDFLQHFLVAYRSQIHVLRQTPKDQRTNMINSQLRYWEDGFSHLRFLINQLNQITGDDNE